MWRPSRPALLALLVGLAGFALFFRPARRVAAEGSLDQPAKLGHCGCEAGEACFHYLRCPFRPPEDACRCGLCAAGGNCSQKERPDKWGAECMGSQKSECFWKRHAESWNIRCSHCAVDEECGACDGLPNAPDAETKQTLARQLALEFKDPQVGKRSCVAYSDRFYVVTDIRNLKVLSQEGAPRFYDAHEVAHLFLQRAEQAYDDFVAVWGDEVGLGKPMGIYLATRSSQRDTWRAAYFGGAKTDMIYGGSNTSKIAGGFCFNGFAASMDEYGDDRDLHAYVRHMVGHILFSCWHGVTGFQDKCPKWAFAGVADWLCRIHPLFEDWTTFCSDEGQGASGGAANWDKKAVGLAARNRTPIESLFAVASLSRLSYDDLVRSWSYMDTMLREDRARWLTVMRGLRDGEEHSSAFREGLGTTPQDFDKRWADRLLGKRRSMEDRPADTAADEATGGVDAKERRRIQAEQDPATLANLIRGLDSVDDVDTAKLVVSKLSIQSDAVRETVAVLLERTRVPAVLEWLRTEGLTHRNDVARAVVARALGEVKYKEAAPALRALLEDSFWLARANAAAALANIADPADGALLVAKLADTNPKAWIAKVDALATFGKAGAPATKDVAAQLGASDWQVRLTACRGLAVFGNADAVSPLIDRLETEAGRLQREILRALRAVTHESMGLNVHTWRSWWKSQQPRGLPPPAPEARNPADDRYAPPKKKGDVLDEPTYYGTRLFSQSLLFVLDVSKSMESTIEVPKDAQEKLGVIPRGQRIEVAKAAAKSAIEKLDPRARFNVVFFSTRVRPWKDVLVPASSHANQAISAIMGASLEDETNIFGALKAAVGLHEQDTLQAGLDPIPDTIYFLTDGTPTRGELTDKDTILSWMRDMNRFAKVELNVIAMGTLGIDLAFLSALASENDGLFIHVPDSK